MFQCHRSSQIRWASNQWQYVMRIWGFDSYNIPFSFIPTWTIQFSNFFREQFYIGISLLVFVSFNLKKHKVLFYSGICFIIFFFILSFKSFLFCCYVCCFFILMPWKHNFLAYFSQSHTQIWSNIVKYGVVGKMSFMSIFQSLARSCHTKIISTGSPYELVQKQWVGAPWYMAWITRFRPRSSSKHKVEILGGGVRRIHF